MSLGQKFPQTPANCSHELSGNGFGSKRLIWFGHVTWTFKLEMRQVFLLKEFLIVAYPLKQSQFKIQEKQGMQLPKRFYIKKTAKPQYFQCMFSTNI